MLKEIGFSLVVNGSRLDGEASDMAIMSTETFQEKNTRRTLTTFVHQPSLVQVELHCVYYEDTSVIEQWLSISNGGQPTVRIEQIDSMVIRLPSSQYELMSYTSGWGEEFESVYRTLDPNQAFVLETRKGRSSRDAHPWFALFDRSGGSIVSASAMWSGNWAFTFGPDPQDQGAMMCSGGLNGWEFWKDLSAGDCMESPHIVVVSSEGDDLNDISIQYARVGRAFWYPHNELSKALPVEWNHWWSYEDKLIDQDVFLRNIEVAERMGIDICTLDAGWFGPTAPDSFWYDYRGDWDLVNTLRFPDGIRMLSDACHKRGLKFGLWCEIEAIGQHARLNQTHPELRAERDGSSIGYICLGNPEAEQWAFQTLDRIISDYDCDWIKLDFNLDPKAGCNRTDHGHGAGDGLFEHIQGYYRLLQRVRQQHPHVLLENCSSGGLRIDLGLLRETHTTFLSDPDWPEHDLQLFWGATTMLAPSVCLHWGYCEWLGEHPKQRFNPLDPQLTVHQLDYYTRISMLGGFGFSQRMPDLPQWVAERYEHHIQVYHNTVAEFVRIADVYRLTEQPKRDCRGDRWAAFQYSKPGGYEHLIFVFRLPGGENIRTIPLRNLESECAYDILFLTESRNTERLGSDLLEFGLTFESLREEQSELIIMRRRISS